MPSPTTQIPSAQAKDRAYFIFIISIKINIFSNFFTIFCF